MNWIDQCHFGDCRETMRKMIADGVKVQTCVTSPPYFGLRDYGTARWVDGDPNCAHDVRLFDGPKQTQGAQSGHAAKSDRLARRICSCGAFRIDSQLGLEETPDQYVSAMVDVFRLVRELLADDGTLWLNIGDSYCSTAPGTMGDKLNQRGILSGVSDNRADAARKPRPMTPAGMKPKDLMGIPWMLAFALRADGWYLRQEIIWHKPNPMPESVRDRCTKAHESIFLLAKSEQYFCDMEAIKEPAVSDHTPGNNSHKGATAYEGGAEEHRTKVGLVAYSERQRAKRDSFKRDSSKRAVAGPGQSVGTHREDRVESDYPLDTRNRRSVWTVPVKPYRGAHFAVYPTELIAPCVVAGSRPGDIVLDPFFGSGTTGEVAQMFGRHFVGCELNAEYEPLQRERLCQPGLMLGVA